LGGRGEHEVVAVEGEGAGQGHHAGPTGGGVFGLGACFEDPAPEDAVAFCIELGFGSVVGAFTVVELAGALGVEEHGGAVEDTGLPDGSAPCGIDEDVFSSGAEWEEVGALPHLAGVDRVGAGSAGPLALGHGVEILPGL